MGRTQYSHVHRSSPINSVRLSDDGRSGRVGMAGWSFPEVQNEKEKENKKEKVCSPHLAWMAVALWLCGSVAPWLSGSLAFPLSSC